MAIARSAESAESAESAKSTSTPKQLGIIVANYNMVLFDFKDEYGHVHTRHLLTRLNPVSKSKLGPDGDICIVGEVPVKTAGRRCMKKRALYVLPRELSFLLDCRTKSFSWAWLREVVKNWCEVNMGPEWAAEGVSAEAFAGRSLDYAFFFSGAVPSDAWRRRRCSAKMKFWLFIRR